MDTHSNFIIAEGKTDGTTAAVFFRQRLVW